ncbi:type III secretion system gatekeeper subunit SctW [Pantoea ananatis]|uniref:type III secretion system gatekeeper subunit SctW n=1 Tax=Pantoea ananas TaxID=553 RepID=UPI0021E99D01|nr:type III secretion system gatekeeper subunit SctW [Pantoea ananatis]MCW0309589.1 Protein MxiC [Pantoea ananatis]MCW0341330.1 Protein MxiC [Pantoea ananatis]MCW0359812.1 Protein MxiC [Pantoea ananatis]MCW0364456.1 Protein MxiC [Pantoea ananatis]MCW1776874.1 type III secretion system gatekeeper subunit SctW [Pantoea ananatis]
MTIATPIITDGNFKRLDLQLIERHTETQTSLTLGEEQPFVNLQEEINHSSEELAEMLSAFGRFARPNRKNISTTSDSDLCASILEESADEKLDTLVRQVSRLNSDKGLLNFVRQVFPDNSDLMLALREMLLSRKLSELQKKKVKEAINDMEKFCDAKKLKSGMNVGKLAKRFEDISGKRPLSAKDLRQSYLRFLECELPAGYLYSDWIDEFGCDNRKRVLAFTLTALITDMKASEPGIHFDEFGLLSAKLSDARILHTLDEALIDRFSHLRFRDQMRNQQYLLHEADIISLYLNGMISIVNFREQIAGFSKKFLSLLIIKQRSEVFQTLRNMYDMTPDFLFSETNFKNHTLDLLTELITLLHKKESGPGISA